MCQGVKGSLSISPRCSYEQTKFGYCVDMRFLRCYPNWFDVSTLLKVTGQADFRSLYKRHRYPQVDSRWITYANRRVTLGEVSIRRACLCFCCLFWIEARLSVIDTMKTILSYYFVLSSAVHHASSFCSCVWKNLLSFSFRPTSSAFFLFARMYFHAPKIFPDRRENEYCVVPIAMVAKCCLIFVSLLFVAA